jgi:hypothetical protein
LGMRDARLRLFSSLEYRDPRAFLVRLRELEREIASSALDIKIRALRTNELKPWRELREAALFAHFMGERIGTRVGIARGEAQDYDFVATWESAGVRRYSPVQIKEVVPQFLNPDAQLSAVIESLKKYPDSADLTVAIHLNKKHTIDLRDLPIPKLSIAALWVFASIAPGAERWGLWGDFLGSPAGSEHDYPAT